MTDNVIVILGSQWGDEGKGKIVDLLGCNAQVSCRFQGGNNAGHTVVVDGKSYDFHLLPCGIIYPNCISVIGNGCVISLPELFDEIERNLGSSSGWKDRLLISNGAHLVFNLHRVADGSIDKVQQIGTTKKGIGPAYSSKALRNGIRIEKLVDDFEEFKKDFISLVGYHDDHNNNDSIINEELAKYEKLAEEIRPCVKDVKWFLNQAIKSGKRILIEGANGCLLDLDHGTYPYVTSSNTTIGGVCTGLGMPASAIGQVYGVVKAYCTRVGDGPFPTELHEEIGKYLQTEGHEVGVTTGRPRRCGWLDLVMLRYTHMLNDYDALAITKLDVLTGLKEIKVACDYEVDGEILESPPMNANKLSQVNVIYQTLAGWEEDISKVRKFEHLPKNAQDYIKLIETKVGVPVKWIGVGQERDAIIEIAQ